MCDTKRALKISLFSVQVLVTSVEAHTAQLMQESVLLFQENQNALIV